MKIYIILIFLFLISSCSDQSIEVKSTQPSQNNISYNKSYNSEDLLHKFSYVKLNKDGSKISCLLNLYLDSSDKIKPYKFQQFFKINDKIQYGSGNFWAYYDTISFFRDRFNALDDDLKIKKSNDNKILLTLNNGITFVEDDSSYYYNKMIETPYSVNKIDSTHYIVSDSYPNQRGYRMSDLRYDGGEYLYREFGEEFSSYPLYVKFDLSEASINGSNYIKIKYQGDGVYKFMDSVKDRSIKFLNDSCVVMIKEFNENKIYFYLGAIKH